MQAFERLRVWFQDVARLPWLDAAVTLRERFREDRLGLTASSLTFTTTMALVPLITFALAVFTAFPIFAKFQDVLQKWLIESLVPDNIARQVLGYLNQFAGKASKLGAVGLAALFVTALALILTIDRTLNSIWRVRTRRPFAQRVVMYWSAMTLGPLLLGASVSLTSYAVSASKGMLPGGVGLVLDLLQFVMVAAGMASMFRYVPNTFVPWGHAWMGGVFVAAGLELAKRVLTMYLTKVPTYSVMYGAFATVPILLVWIYVAWVIVLLGAALTAYVPNLLAGAARKRTGPGWQVQLALEVLRALHAVRDQDDKGLTRTQLCTQLEMEPQRAEIVLETLVTLDWVGKLQKTSDKDIGARFILLANLETTRLEPLLKTLLLPHNSTTETLWRSPRVWADCTLGEVL